MNALRCFFSERVASTRRGYICLVVIILLGCAGMTLQAQTVNGTLLGTITDTTGAVVANAKITATQTSTGAIRETTSNASGNYTIPDVVPGSYSVTATSQGFKQVTQENIELVANTTQRVDLNLTAGSVTESVLVTTAPPLLQTDRADISTKLGTAEIADLPIGTNRNFQSLLNLVPGMAPATFQHSQFFNSQSSLQTNANGIPRMGNLYQIEGIDDDERTGLLQLIIPPADAISTVDISTNNYEAELGRAIGAVTNVTLKSGTNSFHGSAFEYIQNNATNARSYFSTTPLGHLSYNYFGGSIGGPILKNKLFFFGDFLQSIDHESVSNTLTIPDPRYYTPNSAGFIDLSGTLSGAANGCGYKTGQIFDPSTGNGTATAGSCGNRTPFINNQIPFSRVNPVSLSVLQKVNAAAAQYGKLTPNANILTPSNNYGTTLPFTKSPTSYDVKIDWATNEKNHLSARYSWQHIPVYQAPAFGSFLGGPAAGAFEANGITNAYSTGVNYDHVFSSSLLTEVRVGVAHMKNTAQPTDYGSDDATTLGIPGVNIAGQPFTSGQVGISIAGFSSTLIGYAASVPWIRAESNIDFVNNWTKIVRNHTFKFGADLRRVRDDLLQDQTFSPRGVFNFNDVQTSQAGASTSIGNDIASFLLDVPSSAGRDLNTFFPAYRQWWVQVYAGDKWQVTSKLTLDLGVHWDFYPPATPKIPGGFSNYDFNNNQLVLAGLGSNPSNLGMATQYKYFSPRTGFAYRPTDQTVVRGGFGISYAPYPDNSYAYNYPIRANNSYGLSGSSPYTAAVGADNVNTATFQAGFPAPVAIPIPGNGIIPINTAFLTAQNYLIVPQNYKNPYVESWNVAVQQALPADMSLTLAYVANHGVHINANQNLNLPSTTYGGGSSSDPQYCPTCALHRTASSSAIFLGFSSNYQSLQAALTKRMSHGVAFNSAITWAKGMGYIGGDDGGLTFFAGSWRRNYAPVDFDRTFNFAQSFTYALPFGRGQNHLNTGVGALVLGGWKLAGTFQAVTGTPFTVSTNGSGLNTPGTTQTADLTGAYTVSHATGSGNHWFNPAAFSTPVACTAGCPNPGLGNTGRNQFRGPGYISNNFSLFKTFSMWRETALETRIEAFQLSNTPQFSNPSSGNCSSAATTACSATANNFGQVTGTIGSGQGSVNGTGGGRALQASARITF
jgi:Carboxypeptidase regulatory-like domain